MRLRSCYLFAIAVAVGVACAFAAPAVADPADSLLAGPAMSSDHAPAAPVAPPIRGAADPDATALPDELVTALAADQRWSVTALLDAMHTAGLDAHRLVRLTGRFGAPETAVRTRGDLARWVGPSGVDVEWLTDTTVVLVDAGLAFHVRDANWLPAASALAEGTLAALDRFLLERGDEPGRSLVEARLHTLLEGRARAAASMAELDRLMGLFGQYLPPDRILALPDCLAMLAALSQDPAAAGAALRELAAAGGTLADVADGLAARAETKLTDHDIASVTSDVARADLTAFHAADAAAPLAERPAGWWRTALWREPDAARSFANAVQTLDDESAAGLVEAMLPWHAPVLAGALGHSDEATARILQALASHAWTDDSRYALAALLARVTDTDAAAALITRVIEPTALIESVPDLTRRASAGEPAAVGALVALAPPESLRARGSRVVQDLMTRIGAGGGLAETTAIATCRLAAIAGDPRLISPLTRLAGSSLAPPSVQTAAVDAVAAIAPGAAREFLAGLADAGDIPDHLQAIATRLAGARDAVAAPTTAVPSPEVLRSLSPRDDLPAFLAWLASGTDQWRDEVVAAVTAAHPNLTLVQVPAGTPLNHPMVRAICERLATRGYQPTHAIQSDASGALGDVARFVVAASPAGPFRQGNTGIDGAWHVAAWRRDAAAPEPFSANVLPAVVLVRMDDPVGRLLADAADALVEECFVQLPHPDAPGTATVTWPPADAETIPDGPGPGDPEIGPGPGPGPIDPEVGPGPIDPEVGPGPIEPDEPQRGAEPMGISILFGLSLFALNEDRAGDPQVGSYSEQFGPIADIRFDGGDAFGIGFGLAARIWFFYPSGSETWATQQNTLFTTVVGGNLHFQYTPLSDPGIGNLDLGLGVAIEALVTNRSDIKVAGTTLPDESLSMFSFMVSGFAAFESPDLFTDGWGLRAGGDIAIRFGGRTGIRLGWEVLGLARLSSSMLLEFGVTSVYLTVNDDDAARETTSQGFNGVVALRINF